MGRKIEFDYNRAIEKATRLFWEKGYSRTSLRELLRVMQIGEGSFYNSIKSKKQLYLECLKHYNNTVSRRRLDALLSDPSVKRGIRAFFKTVLDELDNPRTPRVCLLAGSLSNDVLEERTLERYVLAEMTTFADHFRAKLETARKNGELPANFKVEITAQIVMTYLQGLFRVIRVLHNRAEVEAQIETLLKGLGL
ncbi:MAG TPA: TetR/AcrR family transcriptional regulator [Pyrinomonadaceae bacterium]|jgi:TetR/AcrR family transcriptional repressor of nem operon|nr:TetR/AcrR family transcriptional regulator [Pyrinomonadaceae bacterium]